jgi:hypothetical protein
MSKQHPDPSAELFERYFGLENRLVSICMKDGSVHRGVFVGFYRGEEDDAFSIDRWHFIPEEKHAPLGIGAGGERIGNVIASKQISNVTLSDATVIQF